MMGLLRAGLAAADGAAAAGEPSEDRAGAGSWPACSETALQSTRSKSSSTTKPAEYTEDHFRAVRRFKRRAERGRDPRGGARSVQPTGWRVNGWVKKGILLGFRMGAIVDMSVDPARQPCFDKATYPVKRFGADERRSHRARRIEYPRRLLHRQGRDLHAADVHQRRRVCGRRHDGRFARAGRKLRADRANGATFRRRRRSAACWSRWARCR